MNENIRNLLRFIAKFRNKNDECYQYCVNTKISYCMECVIKNKVFCMGKEL